MRYKSFILLFLLCCLGNALWGQEQTSARFDFTDFKLENGLRVIVINDTTGHRFSADLVVDYPLVQEGEYAGVSSLVQSLLRTGTKLHTKEEIDSLANASDCNVLAIKRDLLLWAPAENKEAVLSLLAELIQYPTFPETELEKQKEFLRGGLALADNSVAAQSEMLADQLFYGIDHPYGERTSRESLANISQETCLSFHEKYYRPIVSYLVLFGDIQAKEGRFLAEKYFGNWRGQGSMFAAFHNPDPLPESRRLSFVNVPSASSVSVDFGYAIPLRPNSEDVLKVKLLEELVEAKLATTIWNGYGNVVSIVPDKHLGSLRISTNEIPLEMAEMAIADIFDVLSSSREQLVTKQALADAKTSVIDKFLEEKNLFYNQFMKAGRVLSTVRFKLPRNYYNDYLQQINSITSSELLEVAREYLLPGRAHIVVAGDQAIAPSLAQFAGDKKVHYYTQQGVEMEMVEMEAVTENVTAQGVIEKYLSAIGGRERLAAVTDFQMEAEAKLQAETMLMTHFQKNDGMLLVEISIGDLELVKFVSDGKTEGVFRVNTPQEITELDEAKQRSIAGIFPELNYQEKDFQIKLTGTAVLNKKNVHSVEITKPDGRESTHYYDTRTGHLVRTVSYDEGDGVVTDFSDYRTINGVKFPHQIIITGGFIEESLLFQVTTLKVDQGISDDLFKVE